MACYLRHLSTTITKAGINLEKKNRKQVDRLIREWAVQAGSPCNLAWKEIKEKISRLGDEELVEFLRNNS